MSEEELRAWLAERVAEVLERAAHDIDHQTTFEAYGLHSVDAIGLSGDIEVHLGRRVDPTVIWQYPTVASLAGYLARLETPQAPAEQNGAAHNKGT